jgi:hypothetical protein
MSVRSTNNRGGPHIHKAPEPEKPKAPAQANTVQKSTNKATPEQSSRVQSHFEAGNEINHQYNHSFGTEMAMNSPSLPTGGIGGGLASMLGALPKVGISGQFEESAAVAKAEGSFGDPNGIASGWGRVSVLEAAVSGSGSVTFEDGRLHAVGDLAAKATLLDAEGEVRADLGILQAQAQGKAWVGAKAGLHGELTIDPAAGKYAARVGGDAFLGARAGVTGSVSLGELGGVGGRAEAWAGVGVSLRAEASLEGGRFKARFDIGAALGIGFKLGFDVDINFGKIGEAVKNIVSAPVEAIKSVVKAVGNFFKGIFG